MLFYTLILGSKFPYTNEDNNAAMEIQWCYRYRVVDGNAYYAMKLYWRLIFRQTITSLDFTVFLNLSKT